MIAAARQGSRVRIARLMGDQLLDYTIWDLTQPDGVGDIYTGRIEAVMPSLAGRFVMLGDISGFLPDSAGGKHLTEGQYAALRVTRAALGGKGPRLELVADEQPAPKPGLLRRGPGPLVELATRHPDEEIVLDDYELLAQLRPVLGMRARFTTPAFDAVLEDELAALAMPFAALPHGASLHITPAPAATLLDIDAGPASAMPPLALNLALIPELCRQIALRNLSGGILVDFAGLKAAQRQKLAEPLRAALKQDPLRPTLLGISHLGFAEINRRRIRPPLHELLAS